MKSLDPFIRQFREVQPKFARLYARMLAQTKLTQPQYAVLLELVQSFPKPMTMTAISCKLYITKPAVTNLVDRLEKNGFLKRLNHPDDRRVSLLQIQPRGKKMVEKIRERLVGVMVGAVKQLSSEEKKIVQRFYSILSNHADEVLRSPKGCRR